MNGPAIALFGGPPTLDRAAHRIWPDVGAEERAAVARVLDRGILSGSSAPESIAFEDEFARFISAKYALLTHSGTSALELALVASGVRGGDHVLIPAYSFVATALAVLHVGAIPIFVDVDERTGLMDADAARAAITRRTRGLMPVHIHGCAIDLAPFIALAERHQLVLVEDAAQAHGATWRERAVGAIGTAGGFSLQSSKNLSAGEGGVFVTNDEGLAEEANRVRNFGHNVELADRSGLDQLRPLDGTRALESRNIGGMYRGNELTAAFARAALSKLEARTRRAQDNAARLGGRLSKLPGVLAPEIPFGSTSVHHKFRVRLDPSRADVEATPRELRDAMSHALIAEGLEIVSWQTAPLPAQPIFQDRIGFGNGWPWSTDDETDFAEIYRPTRFPRTQRLLESSLVLFSQSCPLIAQSAEVIDRYADAFERVWRYRKEIVSHHSARG